MFDVVAVGELLIDFCPLVQMKMGCLFFRRTLAELRPTFLPCCPNWEPKLLLSGKSEKTGLDSF